MLKRYTKRSPWERSNEVRIKKVQMRDWWQIWIPPQAPFHLLWPQLHHSTSFLPLSERANIFVIRRAAKLDLRYSIWLQLLLLHLLSVHYPHCSMCCNAIKHCKQWMLPWASITWNPLNCSRWNSRNSSSIPGTISPLCYRENWSLKNIDTIHGSKVFVTNTTSMITTFS